jgi:GDP-L-fucose synthase
MSSAAVLVPETSRVYVAGHRGMVGSAMVRLLQDRGYRHIVTRTSAELDLCNQAAVADFFAHEPIDYVVLAAARVGGIHANNSYPAEFIHQNLMIQANVIHEACQAGVEHLLFLGSSCIYPRSAQQPMQEEWLLTGALEQTNEPYAVAKIAGLKMCESYNRQYSTDFRAVMPTNLYGPCDNYHLENSHVIPAIIRKYHLARLAAEQDTAGIARDEELLGPIPEEIRKSLAAPPYVQLWGSGSARREFLHVDDMARGCYHVMQQDRKTYARVLSDFDRSVATVPPCFINIGTGTDLRIREVAELIRDIVGFHGETRYNTSQPDGTPQKLLDIGRITRLGWEPQFSLEDGLRDAYRWYRQQTG